PTAAPAATPTAAPAAAPATAPTARVAADDGAVVARRIAVVVDVVRVAPLERVAAEVVTSVIGTVDDPEGVADLTDVARRDVAGTDVADAVAAPGDRPVSVAGPIAGDARPALARTTLAGARATATDARPALTRATLAGTRAAASKAWET